MTPEITQKPNKPPRAKNDKALLLLCGGIIFSLGAFGALKYCDIKENKAKTAAAKKELANLKRIGAVVDEIDALLKNKREIKKIEAHFKARMDEFYSSRQELYFKDGLSPADRLKHERKILDSLSALITSDNKLLLHKTAYLITETLLQEAVKEGPKKEAFTNELKVLRAKADEEIKKKFGEK